MEVTIDELMDIAERDARRAFGCSAEEAWARIARGDPAVCARFEAVELENLRWLIGVAQSRAQNLED